LHFSLTAFNLKDETHWLEKEEALSFWVLASEFREFQELKGWDTRVAL
jgi:hypothetical protein